MAKSDPAQWTAGGPAGEGDSIAGQLTSRIDQVPTSPGDATGWAAIAARYEREAAALGGRPEAAELIFEAGRIYEERLGDPAAALELYRRSFAAGPGFLPNVQATRRLAAALGDRQLAERAAEAEAAAPPPTLLASARAAAEAAAGAGDRPGLLAALRRCAELGEDAQVAAHHLLAASQIAGEGLGDDALAEVLARAAFARCPDDPLVRSQARLHASRGGDLSLLAEVLRADAAQSGGEDAAHILAELARVEQRLGQGDQAVASLEQAWTLAPDDTRVLSDLAQLRELRRDWAEVADALEALAAAHLARGRPGDRQEAVAAWLRRMELEEVRLDRPAEAMRCCRDVLVLEPGQRTALSTLGRLCARTGDWPGLLAAFQAEAEVAQDPRERAQRIYRAAQVLEEHLGQPAQAAQQYRTALAQDPELLAARSALVRLLERQGRWDEVCALAEAEVAPGMAPAAEVEVLFRLAQLEQERRNDDAAAARRYRRILELQPGDPASLRGLALSLERLRAGPELAEVLARQAAQADPRRRLLLLQRRAEVLEELARDPAAALAAWDEVRAQQPDHLPAVRALGRLHAAAGRWEAVAASFRAQADATSEPSQAAELLLRAAELEERRLARPDAAVALYREVLTLQPSHLAALQALSRLYRAHGEHEALAEVLAALAPLRQVPGERAATLAELGALCEGRLGDRQRAQESFLEALQADPSCLPALRALERLHLQAGQLGEATALRRGALAGAGAGDQAERLHRLAWEEAERRGDVGAALAAAARLDEVLPGSPASLLLQLRLGDAEARARARIALAAREPAPPAPPQAAAPPPPATEVAPAPAAEVAPAPAPAPAPEVAPAPAPAPAPDGEAPAAAEVVLPAAPAPESLIAPVSIPAAPADAPAPPPEPPAPATASPAPPAPAAQAPEPVLQPEPVPVPAPVAAVEAPAPEVAGADDEEPSAFAAPPAEAPQLAPIPRAPDHAELARISEARLEAAADPGSRAAWAVQAGEAWERAGELGRALSAYQAALKAQPAHLPALRAARNLFAQQRDWGAVRATLQAEGAALIDSAEAAAAWREAGAIAEQWYGDAEGAVLDYRAALERDPSDPVALTRAEALLATHGQAQLAEVHAARARAEQDPNRAAEAWLAAARAAQAGLGGRMGALGHLDEALRRRPDLAPALELRARLRAQSGQPSTALEDLERCLALSGRAATQVPLHLAASALCEEKLLDAPGALRHAEAALAQAPESAEALARVARLHRIAGRLPAAAAALSRLLSVPGLPREALLEHGYALAHLEAEMGNLEAASASVRRVLDLDSGHPGALRLQVELERRRGDARELASALEAAARSARDVAVRGEAHLEVARLKASTPATRDQAVDHLRAALELDPKRDDIRASLADAAEESHPALALEHHRKLLERDASRVASWTAVHRLLARSRTHDGAFVSATVLRWLGAATPGPGAERLLLEGDRQALSPPPILAAADLDLLREPADRGPLAEVLALVGDVLAEVLADPREPRGSPVRADHPFRKVLGELARALGAGGEHELYPAPLGRLTVEPGTPPAVRVGADLAQRTTLREQRFLLGRVAARLRTRSTLLESFPAEFAGAVGAAVRVAAPGYSGLGTPDEGLDRRVEKALPRKLRRQLEGPARALAQQRPPPDLAAFRAAAAATADRAGLALCGDVPTALDVILRDDTGRKPVPADRAAILRASPEAMALLAFASSEAHLTLRQKLRVAIA